jgi:hypothetical protein
LWGHVPDSDGGDSDADVDGFAYADEDGYRNPHRDAYSNPERNGGRVRGYSGLQHLPAGAWVRDFHAYPDPHAVSDTNEYRFIFIVY